MSEREEEEAALKSLKTFFEKNGNGLNFFLGRTDSANRWYPVDPIAVEYVKKNGYRDPSRAFPYSYLRACSTKKFAIFYEERAVRKLGRDQVEQVKALVAKKEMEISKKDTELKGGDAEKTIETPEKSLQEQEKSKEPVKKTRTVMEVLMTDRTDKSADKREAKFLAANGHIGKAALDGLAGAIGDITGLGEGSGPEPEKTHVDQAIERVEEYFDYER